nr:unnamed protein product [Callosobruchus chinensis]
MIDWITVKWPVPHKTYCSTGNNELVQWIIPKCGGDGLKVIHGDHSGSLFSIATSIQDFVKKDWKIPSEHLVWTTSHDRQLIFYRIDGEEAEVEKLAMYLTFAGVPECLARNKVNPYRIAIGTSGDILKIWDLTNSTDKFIMKKQKSATRAPTHRAAVPLLHDEHRLLLVVEKDYVPPP